MPIRDLNSTGTIEYDLSVCRPWTKIIHPHGLHVGGDEQYTSSVEF